MIYQFKHPNKEKYVEVVQGINDVHDYFDDKGLKWDRVFGGHQIGISTKIDPFSPRQYIEKTGNQKGSIGDLMDRSAELSEKRAQITGGEDPYKQKVFEEYKKTRGGRDHPHDKSKINSLNSKLKRKGVKVEW